MRAPTLVRWTLLANAGFSAICAVFLLAFSARLAPHFGLVSGTPLVVVALALLPFAVAVGATGLRSARSRELVWGFTAADAAWVLGSVLLLALAWDAIPRTGRALIVAAALVVETFATLQCYGARAAREQPLEGRLARGRAIARSWLSMKPWVKVWLFCLNAVFLLAFLFPHQALTAWILGSYLASGPLLAAIMVAQRGLTRLLGVAHLIPWSPLVVYLLLRLTGDRAGLQLRFEADGTLYVYVLVLVATVVVCLAFDLYDLARWLRGERFVLGFAQAERQRASRRTLP